MPLSTRTSTEITTPDLVLPAYPASRNGHGARSADHQHAPSAFGGWIGCLVLSVLGVTGGIVVVLVLAHLNEVGNLTYSNNNLKQLGMACHNYNAVHKTLPTPKASSSDGAHTVELSWRVSLAPYVMGEPLSAPFDLASNWDSPRNQPLLGSMLFQYARLGRAGGDTTDAASFFQYFTGPNTLWPDNEKRNLTKDIPDGISYTFLIAEAGDAVPWTKPADMVIERDQPLPLPADQFLIAFADGSVRTVSRKHAADATLLQYINPNTGAPKPSLD
jgi:hypothetical protein